MARYHDRYGIAVVCHAHSSESLWTANRARDISIGSGFAVRNCQQGVPTRQLKLSPAKIQREGELATAPGEILVKLARIAGHPQVVGLETHGLGFTPQIAGIGPDRLLPSYPYVEFERYQPTR